MKCYKPVIEPLLLFSFKAEPTHDFSRDDRVFCVHALQNFEKDILSVQDKRASLIEQINGSTLGFCKPRTESAPFTVYPFVEPTQFMDDNTGSIKITDENQGSFCRGNESRTVCDAQTVAELWSLLIT